MKRYGNNLQSLRHVAFVGCVFGGIVLVIVLATGLIYGRQGSVSAILAAFLIASVIAIVLPGTVLLTMVTDFEVSGDEIRWRVCGRVVQTRSIDDIYAVRWVRSPLPVQIEFKDGKKFRYLGMPLSVLSELQKDLKSMNASIRYIEAL